MESGHTPSPPPLPPPPPFSSTASSSSTLIETKYSPFGETSGPSTPPPHCPLMQFGPFSAPRPTSTFPSVKPKVEYPAGTAASPRFAAPEIGSSPTGGEIAGIPRPLESLHSASIPPFLSKTYELVDDPQLDPVISWAPTGESFVVWDPVEFSRAILPCNFKHNNFSSFVRQLNTYVVFFTLGFHKIDTDRWEFANEDFLRGKRSLLKNISRRRSSQIQHIGTQVSSSFDMEKSESEGELQKLRREKNLMMEEVVRLKQEHLITIQQVGALNQRMQSAELRQKQMVSFLAKVLQNPVFLAHLKQQKEQRDVVSRVKRKFLRQHQPSQIDSDKSMEQQIVKYKLNFRDTTSSSPKQGIESGTSKQLPDYILQDMVGKLGIVKSEQEPLGGSNDPGARMLDPSFLDSDTASFKGKGLVNFETDVSFSGGEYFVNSPDDIAPDKMLSDVLVPSGDSSSMTGSRITTFKGKSVINFETGTTITGTEHPMLFLDPEDVPQEKMLVDALAPATNNEDTWNVDFEAGGSSFSTGHDVWDDLVHYDDQGFEVADGAFAFWDLGLHTPEEGQKIDMYVGGESSSQEHRDEGRVLNEDRPKDLEP